MSFVEILGQSNPRSYNSAVSYTVNAVSYRIYSVSSTRLFNAFNTSSITPTNKPPGNLYEKATSGQLKNLTASECINGFAVQIQSSYSNVIVVEDGNSTWNYEDLSTSLDLDLPPFSWICGYAISGDVNCASLLKSIDRDDWKPFGQRVQYCLAEPVDQECKLQVILPLAWTVVACSAIKFIILTFVLRLQDEPLLTIGDAVSSFLQRPDNTTKNMCLLSKSKINWWYASSKPRRYHRKRSRLHQIVSGRRLTFCLTL